MLYIVATPIGNLADMTYRAVEVLKSVDVILAEDTRHSSVLLKFYNIDTRTISFHGYSSDEKISALVRELKSGKNMALISDAGTPGISDPAYAIIKRAIEEGIQVVPIPGASACITALMAAGVMTHHFFYAGFLPIKKGRKTMLTFLQTIPSSIVVYESSHRLLRTLTELASYFPHRRCVVARELTKKFEEFVRGDFASVISHFQKSGIKGEFVILIDGE